MTKQTVKKQSLAASRDRLDSNDEPARFDAGPHALSVRDGLASASAAAVEYS